MENIVEDSVESNNCINMEENDNNNGMEDVEVDRVNKINGIVYVTKMYWNSQEEKITFLINKGKVGQNESFKN